MSEAGPHLLCDEMLASLARWLRAAGYDTALAAQGQPDAELVALARADDRVLITRDRRLAHAAAASVRSLLLVGDDLDAHARTLADALGVDWTLAPFTRCVVDNAPLRPATAEEVARMPATSRARPGPFNACPACGRLYWPGSHVKRMETRLRRWRTPARP